MSPSAMPRFSKFSHVAANTTAISSSSGNGLGRSSSSEMPAMIGSAITHRQDHRARVEPDRAHERDLGLFDHDGERILWKIDVHEEYIWSIPFLAVSC